MHVTTANCSYLSTALFVLFQSVSGLAATIWKIRRLPLKKSAATSNNRLTTSAELPHYMMSGGCCQIMSSKPLAAVLLTTCDGCETRPPLFMEQLSVDEDRLRTLQLLITPALD